MILKQTSQGIFPQIGVKNIFLTGFLLMILSACASQVQRETLIPSPLPLPGSSSVAEPSIDMQNLLNLEEANIISVSFERLESDLYRFDVTLQHDDEGEAPNYANFWQVEDLDGNVLGKRVLTHSHSNEPFTRSETVSILKGITKVIVRGHDINHGFGGQAMRVDLLSGEIEGFAEIDALE